MRENTLTQPAMCKASKVGFLLRRKSLLKGPNTTSASSDFSPVWLACSNANRKIISISKSLSESSSFHRQEGLKVKRAFQISLCCNREACSASALGTHLRSIWHRKYLGAKRPSKRRKRNSATQIALYRQSLCTRLLIGCALRLEKFWHFQKSTVLPKMTAEPHF